MKIKVKIIIDVLMTIIFLIMMGYHQTGTIIHEWFGICLAISFMLHNFLNLKWYVTISKGKYTFKRIARLMINIILLTAFVGAMVSGIIMSKYIFGFLDLRTTIFARRLHMLTTSWSFVLMSAHLGLHWSIVVTQMDKKFRNFRYKCVFFQIITFVCVVLGCLVLVQKEFWNELFLLVDFIFLNYQESFSVFLVKQLLLMIPFMFLGYRLTKAKRLHLGSERK